MNVEYQQQPQTQQNESLPAERKLRENTDVAASQIVLHAACDSQSRVLGSGFLRFCPDGSALSFQVMTRVCCYTIKPHCSGGTNDPQIVRRGANGLTIQVLEEVGSSEDSSLERETVVHALFNTKQEADEACSLLEATFIVARDLRRFASVGGLRQLDISPAFVARVMQDEAFPDLLRLVKRSIDSDATLQAIFTHTSDWSGEILANKNSQLPSRGLLGGTR